MAGYYQPADRGGTPPPPPPPKPGGGGSNNSNSHETSRMTTPTPTPTIGNSTFTALPSWSSHTEGYENSYYPQSQAQMLDGGGEDNGGGGGGPRSSQQQQQQQQLDMSQQQQMVDPGDGWVPEILHDKSIQDLATILGSPSLLQALTHAISLPAQNDNDNNTTTTTTTTTVAHPSLTASHAQLSAALAANMSLATRLSALETRLARARATTHAQLLTTHALERQWRARQADMDLALARFSPAALYQELARGVQEQAQLCQAMEDSFLDGGGGGGGGGARVGTTAAAAAGETTAADKMTERDVADWVKAYRDARVLFHLRQERKARWDEGRVGGWR